MAETLASKYLNEIVRYGGIPVRRACMERHLDHLGVKGPARMVYGRLEPLEGVAPMQRWNGEEWEDVDP